MLTAFLPAAAALLTSATSTFTTNDQYQQHYYQQQHWSPRLQSVYGDKQESAFYQQLFATKQTMLPQLVLDDVQINENVVMNTTTTPYFPPAFSHVVLAPPKTTTTRSPFFTFATATTSSSTSAITAVTSTLVKTTASHTMPTRPSPTLTSSLLLSSSSSTLPSSATSSLAAISAMGASTSTSMFFEGDLLPAVFVNSNDINNNDSNNNRNSTSLGLGGVGGTGVNIDDDDDNLNSFYFYETEQFAVLWILFTIIVLGNSAVLFVMFLNKNRKSRMNYFIKQLALADLCVGLLNVLTDIIWRITISWRAGNVACKLIRFSQVCVTYSSTYVLVAMSIDRYDAITHPMNFSKSWKRARHLVAGAWIVSALFSLPILMLYEEKLIQGQTQCWIELGSPWAWQVYMSLVSATLFAFPALIISACYAIIVKTIWAKGSIFVPAERAGFSNTTARRASSRGIIPRAKVKTVKMTFVIVIVFIVCWSPYIIFDLLQVFGHIPQTQTNIAIATFIQSLAPLNSAANPLIYCLFSSTVFRTLSRFPPFKWFTCCCKSYRHNSTQNRCNTVGRRLHNSCDSMRTLTTSLTVSRRSNKGTTRVIICERPKSNSINHNAMSEV
ncbi:cardioacceleratory peptide receptor [Calliphora vicina]|uniref:cardioacceleratory peptide receptor n=1 Tax=Calliphora vicina TaxID=7373 RepID=UPI00325B2353